MTQEFSKLWLSELTNLYNTMSASFCVPVPAHGPVPDRLAQPDHLARVGPGLRAVLVLAGQLARRVPQHCSPPAACLRED